MSYEVSHEGTGTLARLILRNAGTDESVSIVPRFGANVNELVLRKGSACHSVIAGNKETVDFAGKEIFRGAVLFPFPNRITYGAYAFDGTEHQLPINYPEEGNACHGFVYDRPFTVEDTSADETSATAALTYTYDGSTEGYPFPCALRLLYALSSPEGFSCAVTVQNTGTIRMPVGIGWHPFLTFGKRIDDLLLTMPGAEKPAPIGEANVDTCFALDHTDTVRIHTTELRDPRKDLTIRLWQETGPKKCNYLQLYTPPDRMSIAVEPMTCAINAFNNGEGLIVLPPGGSGSACFGISLA